VADSPAPWRTDLRAPRQPNRPEYQGFFPGNERLTCLNSDAFASPPPSGRNSSTCATLPRPHISGDAPALLQIADGQAPKHVARHGLLRPHDEETLSGWLDRYQAVGAAGPFLRPGRGRKPAYWEGLKQAVTARLASGSGPAPELLRYVGLGPR
jgi:hypothetical protein